MLPAIVIGTHTMGLGVIRALGMNGVPVIALFYRPDDMGYVSKYVQESYRVAHPESHEEAFLGFLLTLARKFSGSPLFPVSDESLKIVSKNKPLLDKNFLVACPEWNIVQRFIEKKNTYELAALSGVPIPKTVTPQSTDEVAEFSQGLEYPCLVKPVESHRYFAVFHRKMVKAFTANELMAVYKESERAGLPVMLQELIPGEDHLGVNYNSYFWNRKATVEFTARKLRSSPPELGSPCVAMSQHVPEVLEAGRKILEAMGFYGYSCTEFKRDPRDGVYKLMEVNGRHNLSTLLAVKCGINFPWLHYQHLVNGLIPEQTEYRQNFFWIDVERDLPYLPRRIFMGGESFAGAFSPYKKPHVLAIYDSADIRPFIKRYTDFSRSAINHLFNRARSDPQ